jgi:phosphatidate cytidylyltransferase
MKKKVISAIFIVIILLGILLIPDSVGKYVFGGFFTALALIATYEINKASKDEKLDVFNLVCSYFSVIFICLFGILNLIFNNYYFYLLLIPVLIFAISMVFNSKTNHIKSSISITNSLYVGIGFTSLILLRNEGLYFIIYVFILGMVTDSCAQIGGMLFGKHKLIESISPKKTIEGAIIGTFFGASLSALFAIFLGKLTSGNNYIANLVNPNHYDNIFSKYLGDDNITIIIIILTSLMGSIVGQIGDLTASKIKRSYEIKDFSNIIPGHGGILDRFDSIILISIFLVIIVSMGALI